jgi:hypothetical protein
MEFLRAGHKLYIAPNQFSQNDLSGIATIGPTGIDICAAQT